MAASLSAAAVGAQAVVNIDNWDKWAPEDRADYEKMASLGVLHEFRSPDEEQMALLESSGAAPSAAATVV